MRADFTDAEGMRALQNSSEKSGVDVSGRQFNRTENPYVSSENPLRWRNDSHATHWLDTGWTSELIIREAYFDAIARKIISLCFARA